MTYSEDLGKQIPRGKRYSRVFFRRGKPEVFPLGFVSHNTKGWIVIILNAALSAEVAGVEEAMDNIQDHELVCSSLKCAQQRHLLAVVQAPFENAREHMGNQFIL